MNTEEMRELRPTGSSRRSSRAHVACWGRLFVSNQSYWFVCYFLLLVFLNFVFSFKRLLSNFFSR